jgi:hypothetical protein
MDATAGQDGHNKQYVTPRWVQAWFLKRSRDNWKRKYVKLKAGEKRLKNRVSDVTRSRESWRQRFEGLEAENAALREQAAFKKSGPRAGLPIG